jgi:hypothetical protein
MEPAARGIEAGMIVIFFALIFVFAAILGWMIVLPQFPKVTSDLEPLLRPLHLPAVLSLIDSRHEEVLRDRVSSREMRTIERARTKALIEYFSRIATNSAVILRAAQTATRSAHDPVVRQRSSELAHLALRTRISAIRALSALYLGLIWPGYIPGLRNVGRSYENLVVSHNRAGSLPRLT